MKKAIATVFLLLAAALLVLPQYFGGQAEAAYREALARMSGQGMRLLDLRYERGWFDSRALAELEQETIAGGTAPGGVVRLRIASRVLHGPWHLDALGPIPAAAVVESRVETILPGMDLPPLLLTTRVELDGSGHADLRVPAVERPAGFGEPGLRMPESGGELHFGPGFDPVEGRYELSSLDLTTEGDAGISFLDLRSESAGTRGLGGLFVGRGRVDIEQIRVRHPDGEADARGLAVSFESVPRDGLVDMRVDYRLDSLQAAGRTYDSARLVLSVTGLPAEGLADLRRSAAELPSDPSTGAEVGVLLAHQLPSLLARDPWISLERLEVGTADGKIEASLSIGTRGMTREAIERSGVWLSHLVGEAELRIPRSVLLELMIHRHRNQALEELRMRDPEVVAVPEELKPDIANAARNQLEALLRDGWVAERSGQVETNLRLADAVLTINGKTFPLAGLALP